MATFTNKPKNSVTFGNHSKNPSSFTNTERTTQRFLITEDLLYFLTTEDDELLAVEPLAGGFKWTNTIKQ
jgi:hypothetical protein